MDKAVDIPRCKHKAAAQLKWIFAQAVLAYAHGFGPLAGASVVSAQQMKQVGFLEADCSICFALVINKKREGDARLLTEVAGITSIAQSDGCYARALFAKLLFKFAQLRNMLAAENSAIVAEKDDYGRRITP
jgi:hypothetical protein